MRVFTLSNSIITDGLTDRQTDKASCRIACPQLEIRNSTAKSFKKSPFDLINEPLARWVTLVRENNVPISGDLIQEKALKFAAEKGIKDFCASGGWLSRFKVRHWRILASFYKGNVVSTFISISTLVENAGGPSWLYLDSCL